MRRSNPNKWVISPTALSGPGRAKRDWQSLIAHRSPEIRAMFEQLEARDRAARLEGGSRLSAKRQARQALKALKAGKAADGQENR